MRDELSCIWEGLCTNHRAKKLRNSRVEHIHHVFLLVRFGSFTRVYVALGTLMSLKIFGKNEKGEKGRSVRHISVGDVLWNVDLKRYNKIFRDCVRAMIFLVIIVLRMTFCGGEQEDADIVDGIQVCIEIPLMFESLSQHPYRCFHSKGGGTLKINDGRSSVWSRCVHPTPLGLLT